MAAQPTIYDMLAWQQGGEAGQVEEAEYFYGLLRQAGLVPEDIEFTGFQRSPEYGGGYESKQFKSPEMDVPNILNQLLQQDNGFQDMSAEDIESILMQNLVAPEWYKPEDMITYTPETGGGTEEIAEYAGGKWDEATIQDLVNSFLGLQEGRGLQESILGKFGLEGRLGGTERKAERAQRSALESYIPRETVSRYRGLQGIGGTEAGEAAEAEYLAQTSAIKRREGRGVRNIYGELEDRLFGGQQRWLQNMLG